ncbi:MAG: hypothetical protein JWR75_1645 [Devosia sp.]|nr:hypothetical protein [Devosia sp.]
MTKFTTRVAAALCLAAAAFSPAHAAAQSPEGKWQMSTGEARVTVTLCGDGTQLCAQLTWLSGAARTEGNLALLNGYVVSGARAVDEGEWKGKVQFDGDSATGSIKLVSDDTLRVSGCKLICKTFEFNRI